MDSVDGITVERLALTKSLDAAFLRRVFSIRDADYYGQPAVAIPVILRDGTLPYVRLRLADGSIRAEPTGQPLQLYGLNRLPSSPTRPRLALLLEGESDVWAAAAHGWTAIGIPGTGAWRVEFAQALAGYDVFVWQEPDRAASLLVCKIARDLPAARVITGDADAKDLCELHQRTGDAFDTALRQRLRQAVQIAARAAAIREKEPPALRPAAGTYRSNPVFESALDAARHRDPIEVCQDLGISLRPGRGQNRSGWCPLHQDANPSFSINIQTGRWKCFGCDAHGDVITLLRLLRGVDFKSAVRELAAPATAGVGSLPGVVTCAPGPICGSCVKRDPPRPVVGPRVRIDPPRPTAATGGAR